MVCSTLYPINISILGGKLLKKLNFLFGIIKWTL